MQVSFSSWESYTYFVGFVLIYFLFLWYLNGIIFKISFPIACKYLDQTYFYANMILSDVTKLSFYSNVCLWFLLIFMYVIILFMNNDRSLLNIYAFIFFSHHVT